MKDVKNAMRTPRYLKRTLFVSFLSAIVAGSLSGIFAANRGNIVIFDANWCASCREIVPVARDIASQNGLGFTEIDVDQQTAPKQASGMGLSIPNEEPPQIYFVNKGRATRLFNGQGYRFGNADGARATILQNLQHVLQP